MDDQVPFEDFFRAEQHRLFGALCLLTHDRIEAEEIGRDVELLYAYDELGLTIWTVDGEVCVVQAGRADPPEPA